MTRADAVVAGWVVELERVVERLGPRFARSEACRPARAYLEGLLGDAERKNGGRRVCRRASNR